ncbi:MAG: amino acid permease [Rhodospirillales bacterium]|nr:amino acid permease [Rhodospirillales bacterium]
MPELRRSLSLPLVVLYGLGVTIGAGIYVLLGAAAGRSGIHAPVAFVMASIVMGFSAASFAELSARFPVSAGEAAYVQAGFKSSTLSLIVGFMVIMSGVVSSAAITVGSTGYIREFIDIPTYALIIFIVLSIGAIAAWGIMQSVIFASLFTIIETSALLLIIAVGIGSNPGLVLEIPSVIPQLSDIPAWAAVSSAGLLAFFAFIGFEDIVNLAEEVKQPERTLPWAIFLTLGLGTVFYFLVTAVAVLSVPIDELAASSAPLSYVFGHITGMSPVAVTAIAIVATLNGVIIQIIMAARVLYGLSKQGSIHAIFTRIHPRTQTPLIATGVITAVVLVLALAFPVEALAEWTSRIVLVIFTLVNMSLVLLKRRGIKAPEGQFSVPVWVPVSGFVTCLALLASDFVN